MADYLQRGRHGWDYSRWILTDGALESVLQFLWFFSTCCPAASSTLLCTSSRSDDIYEDHVHLYTMWMCLFQITNMSVYEVLVTLLDAVIKRSSVHHLRWWCYDKKLILKMDDKTHAQSWDYSCGNITDNNQLSTPSLTLKIWNMQKALCGASLVCPFSATVETGIIWNYHYQRQSKS